MGLQRVANVVGSRAASYEVLAGLLGAVRAVRGRARAGLRRLPLPPAARGRPPLPARLPTPYYMHYAPNFTIRSIFKYCYTSTCPKFVYTNYPINIYEVKLVSSPSITYREISRRSDVAELCMYANLCVNYSCHDSLLAVTP